MEVDERLANNLVNAVRWKWWKAIEEYLKINKEIVEDKLFNSNITSQQTNVAVVLIKMRSVFQLLLDLPSKLETDMTIEKWNDELDKLTEEFVKDLEG